VIATLSRVPTRRILSSLRILSLSKLPGLGFGSYPSASDLPFLYFVDAERGFPGCLVERSFALGWEISFSTLLGRASFSTDQGLRVGSTPLKGFMSLLLDLLSPLASKPVAGLWSGNCGRRTTFSTEGWAIRGRVPTEGRPSPLRPAGRMSSR
jgi:hypothetical protein